MHCDGCGTDKAAWNRIGFDSGTMYKICDICSNANIPWLPDVSMAYSEDMISKGVIRDPNLCGADGKSIPFSSKREKAVIMKQLGLRQASSADRIHGYRNEEYIKKKKTYFY